MLAGYNPKNPKTAVGAAADSIAAGRNAPLMAGYGTQPITPGPLPLPDAQPYDSTADQAAAARQAQIDSLSNGRTSTQSGGNLIAADDQYNRGLLRQKQRMGAAATDILG